jgi:hypothetical protein
MTSLLLMCALAAAGVEAPPVEEPAKKPAPKVAVKSFVISRDGDAELLDDQGVAWVEPGQGGPMQLMDLLGPRRYIGVQLITLTPELRRHFGVPDDRGVMVSKVIAETPAAQAGIAVGDVLVTADGSPIDNAGDVTEVLKDKQAGDDVQIDLWRDGQRVGLAVGFEEREAKTWNVAAPAVLHPMMFHDRGEVPADAHALADRTFTFRAVRQEELDDTLRALDEYFKSAEWQQRVEQLKSLDLEAVQTKMKALEQRLQDLERQLAEKRR